jgi:hypothetical protein
VNEHKTPEQLLAEQQAKQEISRRYIDPRENDPLYQDLVDRNRIHVAPSSAVRARPNAVEESSPLGGWRKGLEDWVRKNPAGSMLAATAAGIVLALLIGR